MNSYGKFDKFEIRDIVRLDGLTPKRKYDLVCWSEDRTYCWSIAHIWWNEKEPCFEFESVGLRYLESSTEALNKWVMKWCEMKELEIINEDERE